MKPRLACVQKLENFENSRGWPALDIQKWEEMTDQTDWLLTQPSQIACVSVDLRRSEEASLQFIVLYTGKDGRKGGKEARGEFTPRAILAQKYSRLCKTDNNNNNSTRCTLALKHTRLIRTGGSFKLKK